MSRGWWLGLVLVVMPTTASATIVDAPVAPVAAPTARPLPTPSWLWLATQLLPSPGVAVAAEPSERSGLWLQGKCRNAQQQQQCHGQAHAKGPLAHGVVLLH